jgi:hypothetical protein
MLFSTIKKKLDSSSSQSKFTELYAGTTINFVERTCSVGGVQRVKMQCMMEALTLLKVPKPMTL